MQSHGKLCKEANKTSSQTAHLFIRVLASLHCNVGCPVNGEEMRFTSWEEMVRDDHPPIHLVTSSEFYICVPSVATDERGCASCIMDELERMEARRCKLSVICLMRHLSLGHFRESDKRIATPSSRHKNTQTDIY